MQSLTLIHLFLSAAHRHGSVLPGCSCTGSQAGVIRYSGKGKARVASTVKTEEALAVIKGMYEGRGGGMLQLVDDTGKGVYNTIKIGDMGGGTLHWNAHRVLQLLRDLSMTPPSFMSEGQSVIFPDDCSDKYKSMPRSFVACGDFPVSKAGRRSVTPNPKCLACRPELASSRCS
jgi:hypothetical protein